MERAPIDEPAERESVEAVPEDVGFELDEATLDRTPAASTDDDESSGPGRRGRRRRRGRRGRRDRETTENVAAPDEIDVDFDGPGAGRVVERKALGADECIDTPFESGEIEFEPDEQDSTEERPARRRRRRRRSRGEQSDEVVPRRIEVEEAPLEEIDDEDLVPARTAALIDDDDDTEADFEEDTRAHAVRAAVPSWSDAISDIIARNTAGRQKSSGSGGGSGRRGRGRGGRRPGPRDRS